MSSETKILGIGLAITLVLVVGAVALLGRGSSSPTVTNNQGQKVYQIDYSRGEKIGSDSAKVKLVEFSDLQCPACAAAHPYVKDIVNSFPQDKFQLVYRHFPLPQHLLSRQVVTWAEAAGKQGKFWPFHDKLFETQEQWTNLTDPTDFFTNLAKQVSGLDVNKLKQDLNNPSIQNVINQDLQDGKNIEVNATPTFYLNGKKLNLQSFNDLKVAIQQEIGAQYK